MAKLLWEPSGQQVADANMTRYIERVNEWYGLGLTDYHQLYEWSVTEIEAFWESLWRFLDIIHSKDSQQVVDHPFEMPGARWFTGAELNFAENLLRFRDDRTALVFKSEAKEAVRITYGELYDQVARMAASLNDSSGSVERGVNHFLETASSSPKRANRVSLRLFTSGLWFGISSTALIRYWSVLSRSVFPPPSSARLLLPLARQLLGAFQPTR